MRKIIIPVLLFWGINAAAQTDTVFHIACILPFNVNHTYQRIHDFMTAHDVSTANKVRLNEESVQALDFYLGVRLACKKNDGKENVRWHFYDNRGNDSITQVILRRPELKEMSAVVGSTGFTDAIKVAEFCRENQIANVQPFVPSKSLGLHNPYHLKLIPTIETHVDNLFQSIVDSFPGANVIIYTPNADINLSIALRFDSLFKQYNEAAPKKFNVVFINTKDMLVNGKKTTAAEQLRRGVKNVWILTSFNENIINGAFRVMYDNKNRYDLVVYGMPNWLQLDNIRLDYLNHFNVRYSDAFHFDSTSSVSISVAEKYYATYHTPINRYSSLGYDVANFLKTALSHYGKNFLDKLPTTSFKGVGYRFEIQQNRTADNLVNYYETKHANVFMVQDYLLKKIR